MENTGHGSFCIHSNSHGDQLMVELNWPGPDFDWGKDLNSDGLSSKCFKCHSQCKSLPLLYLNALKVDKNLALMEWKSLPAMNHRLHWEEIAGFWYWISHSVGRSTEKEKNIEKGTRSVWQLMPWHNFLLLQSIKIMYLPKRNQGKRITEVGSRRFKQKDGRFLCTPCNY